MFFDVENSSESCPKKKRMSILATLVILFIKFYKVIISPLIHLIPGAGCRFHPSCSQYATLAVQRFGAIKGFVMGVCRILRCNPFCKGGFDYVPKKFSWRKIFSQNCIDE